MRFAGDRLEAAQGDGTGCGLVAVPGTGCRSLQRGDSRQKLALSYETLFLPWHFIPQIGCSRGTMCARSCRRLISCCLLFIYEHVREEQRLLSRGTSLGGACWRITAGKSAHEPRSPASPRAWRAAELPAAAGWRCAAGCAGGGSPRVLGTHTRAFQSFESPAGCRAAATALLNWEHC